MKDLEAKPQVIPFEPGNVYVSDLAFSGNWLYATVRDASLIYRGEIVDPANVAQTDMEIFTVEISGPNGLQILQDTLLVASYPLQDSIGMRNTIYIDYDVKTIDPQFFKLESMPGYYCGIAYLPKTKMLYYTDDINGQLREFNLKTGLNKIIIPPKIFL